MADQATSALDQLFRVPRDVLQTEQLLHVPRHELHLQRFLYIQAQLAQVMIGVNGAVDTNAVTLTINGRATTFEFDNNSTITAGRVAVTIGGTNAITGANFIAAIISVYADVVRCYYDTNFVYVVAANTDVDMAVSVVAGTMTADKLVLARPQQPLAVAFINRTVTASDVTRATVNTYTGIDNIYFIHTTLRTSGGNFTAVPWNGTIGISGEIVQLNQGTSTGVYASGNIFQLLVMGDKTE